MGPHHDESGSKPCCNGTAAPPPAPERKEEVKVVERWVECQRNHAATIGRYAVDGCREFMALGSEGTTDELICVACHCHRNFHRREVVEVAVPVPEPEQDWSSDATTSGDRR